MKKVLLKTEDLTCYFDVSSSWLNRVIDRTKKQTLKAVDGVSFEILEGETFSLVGESGCGKSTIAKLIAGLYQPTKGKITFKDVEISTPQKGKRRLDIQSKTQMIFQDPYSSLNPRWRIGSIISEPMLGRRHLSQKRRLNKQEVDEQVVYYLEQVGLSASDAKKFPHEFSGGQRQRISIARALAGEPEFLICDEPTSALDVSVQAQILNLMKTLQQNLGLTYLMISHDLAVVYHISTKVGVMYLGKICEWGETKALFRSPKHPYTRMLLDAIPDLDMTGKARIPVTGEIANPIHPPSGCSFHPRCPYANERCKQEVPTLKKLSESYIACHGVEEKRI